ncbi:MAG TPA: gliding motility-associated C-terminal domain-containing protein, partial [Paludibacter sp.]|nr:gliding motility-associated C-terminal domain-containing protein [Paludibacter sp.]
ASSTQQKTICATELPFYWNNIAFSKSEIRTITLKNILGCDSVATLNLTVLAASSIRNKIICETQLPYNWNSITFTKSESKTVTLKNILGCDSVATLNLTVLSATSKRDSIVCVSQVPFIWNKQVFSTSGTKTVTLKNILGCDSVATLNLTVLVASSTQQKTICATELPFYWNNIAFSKSEIRTITLKNILGCDSVATLNLTVVATSSTQQKTICETQLPFSWNNMLFTKADTKSFTYKNILNCDSVATFNLTVLAASSTQKETICETQLPFYWNNIVLTESGSKTVTLKNILGCDSVVTLNLTVLAANSTQHTSICATELPFYWNNIVFSESGTKTVELKNILGCDSVATLDLKVTAQGSILNADICLGQSYTFNDTIRVKAGTYTAHYFNQAGCDSIVTMILTEKKPTASKTRRVICPLQLPFSWNNISCPDAGTYTARLTNSVGCDSIATLELIVESPIVTTSELTICPSELPYLWNGINYTKSGIYTADLKTPAGCDSVTTLILKVNSPTSAMKAASVCEGEIYEYNGIPFSAPGSYDVKFQNSEGCDSIVTLVINSVAGSNISQVVRLLPGETYSVNGKIYDSEGVYTEVIKTDACDSVVVTEVSFINVPNTLTPNGDGANDLFMKDSHVKVYNRNGVLLFDGTSGWDGKYKNKYVSNDTYFYVLFTDDSRAKTIEGYITVVR